MPKKAIAGKGAYALAKPIQFGTVITDNIGRSWKIESIIGQGGFGRIYSGCSTGQSDHPRVVIKIEPQNNGPLFTEINFYLRVCKQDLIDSWKNHLKLAFLGVPTFIGTGLCTSLDGQNCRFLVMDRFSGSLEEALSKRQYTSQEIPLIVSRILDALEYIHSKDYVHADIKASNILLGNAKLEVYLVDFGLATLYRVKGLHKAEKVSPKLRDNGTLEFCPRDAHAALPLSRRGDLEILAYNLVHWLYRSRPDSHQGPCAGLPWEELISDPAIRRNLPAIVRGQVVDCKERSMTEPSSLALKAGFGLFPELTAFIALINRLQYSSEPDYARLHSRLQEMCPKLVVATKKSVLLENHLLNRPLCSQSKRLAPKKPALHSPSPRPLALGKVKASLQIDLQVSPKQTSASSKVASSKTVTFPEEVRRSPRLKLKAQANTSPLARGDAMGRLCPVSGAGIWREPLRPRVLSSACQTSPDLLVLAKREAAKARR